MIPKKKTAKELRRHERMKLAQKTAKKRDAREKKELEILSRVIEQGATQTFVMLHKVLTYKPPVKKDV